MEHSDPGRRACAGDFDERLFEKVGGDRHAIGRACACVGERGEILRERG